MSTTTGGDLNLTKPELTDQVDQTVGTDLPNNFQTIDDRFTEHQADKAPHPNIPSVRVTHSVSQSIADATVTVLSFDTERFDNDAIHDTAVDNSRLTAQTPGKYLIAGNVEFAANSTGMRTVAIRINGTTFIAQHTENAGANVMRLPVSSVYDLAAGDYAELIVYQSSGASLDVTKSNQHSPEFMMVKVG